MRNWNDYFEIKTEEEIREHSGRLVPNQRYYLVIKDGVDWKRENFEEIIVTYQYCLSRFYYTIGDNGEITMNSDTELIETKKATITLGKFPNLLAEKGMHGHTSTGRFFVHLPTDVKIVRVAKKLYTDEQMKNQRNCPACGGELTEHEEKCPICGLEGLNQLFLSRADYEKWLREVLEPHMATLAPKVFAGKGFGLILTARGELYGIGENYSGQINENGASQYEQPRLMAKDVVSAAAGSGYSIYVTRDGKVHLRGRGELVERFSGFCWAKAVYADSDYRFWIVDMNNQVWAFGENRDEELQKKWETPVYQFPEAIGTTAYHYEYEYDEINYSAPTLLGVTSIVWWEENGVRTDHSWYPKSRFEESEEFMKLKKQYGYLNLQIKLNESYLGVGSPIEGYGGPSRYLYRPVVYITNKWIYEPVQCPDAQWMIQSPHREGSKPTPLSQWEDRPNVKKQAHRLVCLMDDDTVEVSRERLKWLEQPVADISVFTNWYLSSSNNMFMFTCKNGDILWSNNYDDVEAGTMNRCRLPMNILVETVLEERKCPAYKTPMQTDTAIDPTYELKCLNQLM